MFAMAIQVSACPFQETAEVKAKQKQEELEQQTRVVASRLVRKSTCSTCQSGHVELM